MTWGFTFDNFSEDIPADLIEAQRRENSKYPDDIKLALQLARVLKLGSGAIAGMRMANPYNDDEVVDISVRGRMGTGNFIAAVKRDIAAGPDPIAHGGQIVQTNVAAAQAHAHEWIDDSREVAGYTLRRQKCVHCGIITGPGAD